MTQPALNAYVSVFVCSWGLVQRGSNTHVLLCEPRDTCCPVWCSQCHPHVICVHEPFGPLRALLHLTYSLTSEMWRAKPQMPIFPDHRSSVFQVTVGRKPKRMYQELTNTKPSRTAHTNWTIESCLQSLSDVRLTNSYLILRHFLVNVQWLNPNGNRYKDLDETV